MSFCLFVCFSCMLTLFSHAQLFVILWTVACQVPLSMGFSRQEYWGGLLCPSPGDLPESGMESTSLRPPALASGFFTPGATWEAHDAIYVGIKKNEQLYLYW